MVVVLAGVNAAQASLVGSETNDLFSLDAISGAATFIGAVDPVTSLSIQGLAHDPLTGTLYGTDTAGDQLVRIDPTTGLATVIGPHVNVASVNGLAFDPNANVLYGADSGIDSLVRIAPTTGLATVVGNFGWAGNVDMSGLAFDPTTNTLYGNDVQAVNDRLFRINTVTGVASAIGNVGVEGVTGLAFDPNTNTLYGVAGAGTDSLVTLDTATGVGTIVGPYSPAANDLFGLTYVPEPASTALAALAGATLARRRR